MASPSDPGDPYDWDIDQVVGQFCHNPNPAWASAATAPPLPEPSSFEEILRSNHVTGEVLLTEVTRDVLLGDFGIKSLGQRYGVEKAIRYLRTLSPKYRNQVQHSLQSGLSGNYSPQTPFSHLHPVAPSYSPHLSSTLFGPLPSGLGSPHPDRDLESTTVVESLETPIPKRTLTNVWDTSNPSQALDDPSQSHDQSHGHTKAATSFDIVPNDPQSFVAGSNYTEIVDANGRKRKRLALHAIETTIPGKRQKTSRTDSTTGAPEVGPDPQYLNRRGFSLKDFYRDSDEFEDNDDFVILGRAVPAGERLEVARFTRRHLNGAPRQKILAPLTITKPVSSGPFTLSSASKDTSFDHLLLRYPPGPDNDGGLAPYGDSGSENGFDSDTLKEIEEEKVDKEQRIERNRLLAADVVQATIDASIAIYCARWKKTKLPLAERKAYRLWTRATRDRTRNMNTRTVWEEVHRLNDRLDKQRANIAANSWTKVGDLEHQCEIMEQSVFQREEQLYFINVLECDQCPPKPPPRRAEPSRRDYVKVLSDEEELLDSDDGELSNDGLDDFIVGGSNDASFLDQQTELDPPPDFDTVNYDIGVDADDDDSENEIISSSKKKRVSKIIEQKRPGGADSNLYLSLSQPARGDDSDSTTSSHEQLQDSDLDLPHLPKSKYTGKGNQLSTAIDLTMSDPPGIEMADNHTSTDSGIRTPALNPVLPQRTKLVINGPKPVPNLRFKISSPTWPGLDDIDGICSLRYEDLEQRGNPRRLVIKMLGEIDRRQRQELTRLIQDGDSLWLQVHAALQSLLDDRPGDQRLLQLATLYIAWVNCKYIGSRDIPKAYIHKAISDQNGFNRLCETLRKSLSQYQRDEGLDSDIEALKYEDSSPPVSSELKAKKTSTSESGIASAVDESEFGTQMVIDLTRRKKRKRAVAESLEAIDQQKSDRLRVEEQERRKAALARRWEKIDLTTKAGHAGSNPISFGDPVIYLHEHIGSRVKPHQLNGIQFMWRELITDTKQQGCLLAHTMGLGKTMQVISLLVTIAIATKSEDAKVRSQIPQRMRTSRTLVLCPPSLIENWWDEFLIWTPESLEEIVGQLRKIASSMPPSQRLAEISCWYEDGGVLIMSYDLLRQFIYNKKTKNRDAAPLTDEVHERVKRQLLSGPSIVAADEAHKMKNLDGLIAQAASQFETKSRIALTGSPLANNLDEYYAMIEWIAPGYLGNKVQFKAKYSEPISEGFFQESSHAERRRAIKKLQVLKETLDPKVNRADITVLAGSLPSKTEFFITIPLTGRQKRAYKILIRAILGDGDDKIGNARLWEYLAILSMLCNHPRCFVAKLEARRHQNQPLSSGVRKGRQSSEDSDDEIILPGDPSLANSSLSDEVIEELMNIFDDIDDEGSLDDTKHSHRVELSLQIIHRSIAIGDKVLLFSHSIPTLDYLQAVLENEGVRFLRLDGSTKMSNRQVATKNFNSNHGKNKYEVFLISIRAGGLGLNLYSANRIIIFDFQFNPQWEEQAVGRAYRLGQKKPVFVYRFRAGGTFEDVVKNKAIFKTQLSSRVVDKKKPVPWAKKGAREFLFPPRDVEKLGLNEFFGKDVDVLDKVMDQTSKILSIELTETFLKEDNETLTAEEQNEVRAEIEDERFKRNDPSGWQKKQQEKRATQIQQYSRYNLPTSSTPRSAFRGNNWSSNASRSSAPDPIRSYPLPETPYPSQQYSAKFNRVPPIRADGSSVIFGNLSPVTTPADLPFARPEPTSSRCPSAPATDGPQLSLNGLRASLGTNLPPRQNNLGARTSYSPTHTFHGLPALDTPEHTTQAEIVELTSDCSSTAQNPTDDNANQS